MSAAFLGLGTGVQDVGDDIRTAAVFDPFKNVLGLIDNPHFKGAS